MDYRTTQLASHTAMAVSGPIARTCRDCAREFTISEGELAFFRKLAQQPGAIDWTLPRRCTSCRAASRRQRLAVKIDDPDLTMTCVECGATFAFGGRDTLFFAARGWSRPRRCRPCRQQRNAERTEERPS